MGPFLSFFRKHTKITTHWKFVLHYSVLFKTQKNVSTHLHLEFLENISQENREV